MQAAAFHKEGTGSLSVRAGSWSGDGKRKNEMKAWGKQRAPERSGT